MGDSNSNSNNKSNVMRRTRLAQIVEELSGGMEMEQGGAEAKVKKHEEAGAITATAITAITTSKPIKPNKPFTILATIFSFYL